jgi:hypothetical protein
MNWRWPLEADVRWRMLVGGFLAFLLVTGGLVAYVRIADVHGPGPAHRISTESPPGEMIDTANEAFQHVDHRTVTRVYVQSGSERERAFAFEHLYDYSDRQYLAQVVNDRTVSSGGSGRPQYTPYSRLFVTRLESSGGTWYLTDGRLVVDDGSPQQVSIGQYRFQDADAVRATMDRRASLWQLPYAGNVFLQGASAADWSVVSENESTLVLGIDDHEEYYETRRMYWATDIHEGSSIRVYIDRVSGRVDRIVEHRIASYRVVGEDGRRVEERRHYVVVTEFSEYGTLDVKQPGGVGSPTLAELWWDFLHY